MWGKAYKLIAVTIVDSCICTCTSRACEESEGMPIQTVKCKLLLKPVN